MQRIVSGILLACLTSGTLSACMNPMAANLIGQALKEQNNEPKGASPAPSPSASTSSLPDAAASASLTGMKASNCSLEGSLKSASGAATTISFANHTNGEISIYWLDFNGQRKLYKKLAAGQNYEQSTYLTHPWLVANAQDNCIGIYTPEAAGTASVKLTSQGSSAASTGAGRTGGQEPVTGTPSPERVQQAIACLKAKGDTTHANALSALLNVYNSMSKVVGPEIAAQGYLSGATAVIHQTGC